MLGALAFSAAETKSDAELHFWRRFVLLPRAFVHFGLFDLEQIYKVRLIMERGLRRLLQNDVKIWRGFLQNRMSSRASKKTGERKGTRKRHHANYISLA